MLQNHADGITQIRISQVVRSLLGMEMNGVVLGLMIYDIIPSDELGRYPSPLTI